MSNEHTPTTDRIRDLFSFAVAWDAEPTEPHIIATQEKALAQFDRMIAQTIAAAKAEAYREAQQIIAGDMTIDEQRGRRGADKIDAAYLIQEIDTEIQDLMEGDDE